MNTKNTDEVIARENYNPTLSDEYKRRFEIIVQNLCEHSFPNRVQVLGRLIKDEQDKPFDASEIEKKRFIVSLQVLRDLLNQGWSMQIADCKLLLSLQLDKMSDKDKIRFRMRPERDAQFSLKPTKAFLDKLETKRSYNGQLLSIKDLYGDKELLAQGINNQSLRIDPYIQLVSHKKDEHTGFWLSDIWRYFRYTWAIPYKTMPGRNLFYLVRDSAQLHHPVIGIFALGNTVLNLSVRDDDLGWTVAAIKKELERRAASSTCIESLPQNNGSHAVKIYQSTETEAQHIIRLQAYSKNTIEMLLKNLDKAIAEMYVADFKSEIKSIAKPTEETIKQLRELYETLRIGLIDNEKTKGKVNFKEEAQSRLFKKKRAQELSNLLSAKIVINQSRSEDYRKWLEILMSKESGRVAVHTALIANRKNKIGSNMMEIIVCGAIPPYNNVLGGKLVSMLACSPLVIAEYTKKYQTQVSEIASRMKGAKVVRDSRLVYLGTTSLYATGSSQYNRIKIPIENQEGFMLSFKRLGITEGYGSNFFSKETTMQIQELAKEIDGGKKINNIFGEGTSPRFRIMCRGMAEIGIKSEIFLRHHSPRIVYGIELAKNTKEFLLGYSEQAEFYFNLESPQDIMQKTDEIINFWKTRWLNMRLGYNQKDGELKRQGLIQSVEQFDADAYMKYGNNTGDKE